MRFLTTRENGASMGEMSFLPILNIPKSQSVKVGETIEDLIREISAIWKNM